MAVVVAVWAAPWLELGCIMTMLHCGGPRSSQGTLGVGRWVRCGCGAGCRMWPDVAGSGSCDGDGLAWSAALCGAGNDGGALLIDDSGLWWWVVVHAGGGSHMPVRGEDFFWLLGVKALLWPCPEPTAATLVGAAYLFGGVFVRGPKTSSLALRRKPLFLVPGTDDGGALVAFLLGGFALEWSWHVTVIGLGGARPWGRRGARNNGSKSSHHEGV
uniref:Predicted protein n=1 Tax=Hordeum vulgare subsp. vulgare TaxID=112509 RepID=F2EF14_HORVV|nr:predicted protein [Hordeum vulgare subsp. vulgare]